MESLRIDAVVSCHPTAALLLGAVESASSAVAQRDATAAKLRADLIQATEAAEKREERVNEVEARLRAQASRREEDSSPALRERTGVHT